MGRMKRVYEHSAERDMLKLRGSGDSLYVKLIYEAKNGRQYCHFHKLTYDEVLDMRDMIDEWIDSRME